MNYFKFTWTNSKVLIGAIVFSFVFIFLFRSVPLMSVAFAVMFVGLLIWSVYDYKQNTK